MKNNNQKPESNEENIEKRKKTEGLIQKIQCPNNRSFENKVWRRENCQNITRVSQSRGGSLLGRSTQWVRPVTEGPTESQVTGHGAGPHPWHQWNIFQDILRQNMAPTN